MYKISKEFHFSAAHRLDGLPEGHPCGREHGHNYIVVLVLESDTLDEHGFVRDYGDLNSFKRWIDDTLDHRHLNDIMTVNPTAEHLARFIHNFAKSNWPEVAEVRVSETPKTWAVYRS